MPLRVRPRRHVRADVWQLQNHLRAALMPALCQPGAVDPGRHHILQRLGNRIRAERRRPFDELEEEEGVTGSAIDQRGRVMGFMQMGFGASQVLGVPIGLYLATLWGWQ